MFVQGRLYTIIYLLGVLCLDIHYSSRQGGSLQVLFVSLGWSSPVVLYL